MRKLWISFLVSLLLFSGILSAQEPFVGDLVRVESLVYGEPQKGAVIERLDRIENLLFGRSLPGTVAERQKRLVDFVFGGAGEEYPLAFKVASLEWIVLQEVFPGPLANRIDKLEEMILGSKRTDKPVAWRIENLMKLCVPTGEIKMSEVDVPRGQLVKVALLTPLDSRNNKTGDQVRVRLVDDLIFNGILVAPRGSMGVGEVVKVERAGAFGKSGKVDVKFKYIESLLAEEIPICMGERAAEESKKEMEGRAWAVVTSFVGLGVFGPVGLVAGAFVHGEEAKIPAGAKFYLEVSEDVKTRGLVLEGVAIRKPSEPKKEVEPKGDGEGEIKVKKAE